MIFSKAHIDDIAGHFYDALKVNLVRKAQFEIGCLMLDEVAYGWIDIRKHL